MKTIWIVILGEEYSHSNPVAASFDKDKAIAMAEALAAEKNMPLDGEQYWYDGLCFIKITPIDVEE